MLFVATLMMETGVALTFLEQQIGLGGFLLATYLAGYSERFILSSLRQTETNNELTNHAVLYASSRLPKAIVVLPACAGARGSRRERSLDKKLRLASNGAYASSERRANRHNNSGVIIAPATRGVAPYNRLVREVAKVTNSSSL